MLEQFCRTQTGGIFSLSNPASIFSIDGSIIVPSSERLFYSEFFIRSQRTIARAGRQFLRGPRYLASINPVLEVRQKLRILQEDLQDAVRLLIDDKGADTDHVFQERIGVLDYAKNGAITLFNALVQPEKQGSFRTSDCEYQRLRAITLAVAVLATQAYYAHLFGRFSDYKTCITCLFEKMDAIDASVAHIEKQYVDRTFSSRHLQRPEAGHPLVLAASAFVAARAVPGIDVVVGLPSGGTEFALLQQYAVQALSPKWPVLMLLPYSLHSAKNQFDKPRASLSALAEHLRASDVFLADKTVLIAEDNSSTGRTISDMLCLLKELWPTSRVHVAVAEADLIRSIIDRDSPDRTHLADSSAYKYSMNLLPVSRRIAPKEDIRGIVEERRLVASYRARLNSDRTAPDQIMHRAFLRMLEDPTEDVLPRLNDENAILRFENTPLSNFYITPKPIRYRRISYPSVEHAYQAQKFADGALARVTAEHKAEIREILRVRGQKWNSADVEAIFTDPNMSAGAVKVSANHLRDRGYVREDWDDVKIRLMIGLLIQKYEQPRLKDLLQATKAKYLVEGNTWHDTLWGVCDGRGRNLLGLVLMDLRDEYLVKYQKQRRTRVSAARR